MRRRTKIGIATCPMLESGIVPLQNLIEIVQSLSEEVYVITGGAGESISERDGRVHVWAKLTYGSRSNTLTRIWDYIHTQLRISHRVARTSGDVDPWIFFFGAGSLLLPLATAKLSGKKTMLPLASCNRKAAGNAAEAILFAIADLSDEIAYHLSDVILLYSEGLIEKWRLEKHRSKVLVAHEQFVDFSKFRAGKALTHRANSVGYVGRFSQEKGILNLVHAIPKTIAANRDTRFLIAGDGPLRKAVERELREQRSEDRVGLIGWLTHDRLSEYLGSLRLLVVPSYSEGLPNTMLQAMACRTPVLATPVGAIPDVIRDGETGFLMENNSPACIAQSILKVLKYPNLDVIAQNAYALVEAEFSYDKALQSYRDALACMLRRKT